MEKNKSLTIEDMVVLEDLAVNVGSGDLEVYATPMVVALMENVAATLAKEYIEDDFTTVGTKINIEHTSATPLNAKVSATANLIEVDGRKFTFEVVAYDEAGEIAKGEHIRFAVNSEKFQAKTDSKFDK